MMAGKPKKKTRGQEAKRPKSAKPNKPASRTAAKATRQKAAKPAARTTKLAKAPAKAPAPKPAAAPKSASPAQAPAAAAPAPKAEKPARRASQPRVNAPNLPSGVAPFPQLAGVLRFEEPLGRHTTLRIGGPAMVHFMPADVASLGQAVTWAKAHKLPWLVLGLGSNVLIRDGGFRGLVLKIGKGLDELVVRGKLWKAGGGLPTPLLARRTADAGFEGVQRLIGVPGTVGGAVFMNAGAHGQDIASVLQTATVLTPAGEVVEKARKEIPFSYRRSGLDGHVVLGCTLLLTEAPVERVRADMNFVLKKRRDGTPFDQPCCGSVFKNPPD
ncbi:MAG: hypothetical protein A2085_01450, partial [Gemmatimonadetes bacterium GWC2_71_10]